MRIMTHENPLLCPESHFTDSWWLKFKGQHFLSSIQHLLVIIMDIEVIKEIKARRECRGPNVPNFVRRTEASMAETLESKDVKQIKEMEDLFDLIKALFVVSN